MAPPAYVVGRPRAAQAIALEWPQHPAAHERLNGGDIGRIRMGVRGTYCPWRDQAAILGPAAVHDCRGRVGGGTNWA